jgi:hypothetical protein
VAPATLESLGAGRFTAFFSMSLRCHLQLAVPCRRCKHRRHHWLRIDDAHQVDRVADGKQTHNRLALTVQIASEGLKGRVFEVSLADLQKVRALRCVLCCALLAAMPCATSARHKTRSATTSVSDVEPRSVHARGASMLHGAVATQFRTCNICRTHRLGMIDRK